MNMVTLSDFIDELGRLLNARIAAYEADYEYVPPTLRQRFSAVRSAVIGWLHDRLFGSDYCNHDGCYG